MSQQALVLVTTPVAGIESASAFKVVDPATFHISAMDLAVTRGDGIFDVFGVRDGAPVNMDAHLARFARSAAMLDLPAPLESAWRPAIEAAIEAFGPGYGAVKLVMSRGIEGCGVPTGFIYVWSVEDEAALDLSGGISVVTLDRGYRHDVALTSPWLLQGAKTLSYAVNKSALREAARRGFDDVLFVSSDGYLLEGPTSSLILRIDGELFTPKHDLGILPGTTQIASFQVANSLGLTAREELLAVDALDRADAAWLTSSIRGAVPLRKVDDREYEIDSDLTARLNATVIRPS
ncbi:aminodeoxychorismate lyase [Rarobacter incanus]|uniref:4-amino-4-deoxychorismate lyase n=1 Tax=Rarobacter incanus TaxID=153494 RepID=A0A542SNG1_9MICO|nr:aminodeoxychorismate lyase [Rarobacter incanus]TQK76153.1 4-amino-4-deoxychorismate lyase [Rarobacter incanus]